ncbi:MAG TPA: RNA pyrophosphohydrolase [Hyphomicrobiaceae bacterium]|nr:RNA pyrophosphohydrolase [Hyphomicrobiaceae bacterium]
MTDDTTLPDYRPCVGIMIINPQGLIWMGRRTDAPKDPEGRGAWWQMPQGGIDPGEESETAAFRELHEETAIPASSVRLLGRTEGWLTYELPSAIQGRAWKGRYRGQKQVWFAMRFNGSDQEINLDPPPGQSHKREFDEWAWVPLPEISERVVSFKREVYIAVAEQLGSFAKPA